MKSIELIANGIYLPKIKMNNKELSEKLHITEEYIYKRTGIENRYFAEEELEKMAIEAAKDAIKNANIEPDKIELIIVATTSSNKIMPGISYLIQKELNIENCMCLDILAGCSGYINAFDIARNYIVLEKVKYALIVGVDCLSKITNQDDLGTAIILSDGAGATILRSSNNKKEYYSHIISKGQDGDILTYEFNKKLKMDGKKIYKYAVTETVKNVEELLKEANVDLEEIAYIVPHQSNQKIITSIATRLKIKEDKMYSNIKQYGNTFCASIPIVLNEMMKNNKLKKGDKIILLGYGGGLNTGSILIEI